MKKTALVFGASGLVGSHLINLLIDDNNYEKIKIFVRSEVNFNNPKIQIIKTDFKNLSNHSSEIKGDDCFFCIGTTRKNSPNKLDYQRVELEIPKQIAKIAKTNSVNNFSFISSSMANPKHSGEYLRYKGLVEETLKDLEFINLSIIRPSFLVGNRKEKRLGEKVGIFIFKILSPFFIGSLKKMSPIRADLVARAMIYLSNNKIEQETFESNEVSKLGKNY
ncbi:NAD(P)H-binding protein [Alphaproteobacteria bacterium]|nr:NAD(P)H-binding protein [Alphaproteobacteria bacterium]